MENKYEQVKKTLLSMIRTMNPHDRLPSENQLIEMTGFSRPTVKKALQDLVIDGTIYRKPKSGSYVADKRLRKPLTKLTGFTEEVLLSGDIPSTELLSCKVVPAEERIAEILALAPGDLVYNMVRLRLKNGDPIIVENSFICAFAVEGITPKDMEQSLYDYIERKNGFSITSSKQYITSVIADELTCHFLQLSFGSPVIKVEETSYLQDGRPFEYSIDYRNPSKYVLEVHCER